MFKCIYYAKYPQDFEIWVDISPVQKQTQVDENKFNFPLAMLLLIVLHKKCHFV